MNIAALISGGVDSAVVVHLLCEQGYKPDLFYIKIGMDGDEDLTCTAEEDIELCTATARKYGLSLNIIDLHRQYWDNVVAYAIDKVKRGLTPNPDVMCNKLIKFGCFEQEAGHLYDKTATGHYASILEKDGKIWLGTAQDPVKDQTDFLAQIDYLQISKLMFPLGGLMKNEVRDIARIAKLPSAQRKDSQGICFLGKINYNEFLRRFLGEKEGDIIEMETGKRIGTHKGYWFHTIGQRKGLGLGGGPWFVIRKDIDENIIYVSHGYDFKRLISWKGLSKLRLYVQAQNLFTLTKYDGMDPEIGSYNGTDGNKQNSDGTTNQTWVSGVDMGYYPHPRTFIVGINLAF